MDEKVYKYRKRHKDCAYCKHFIINGNTIMCLAKVKFFDDFVSFKRKYRSLFCSCYETKYE